MWKATKLLAVNQTIKHCFKSLLPTRCYEGGQNSQNIKYLNWNVGLINYEMQLKVLAGQ